MLLTVDTLKDCLNAVCELEENQTTSFTVNFPETQILTVTKASGQYTVNDAAKTLEEIFGEFSALAAESLYYRKFELGSSEYLDEIEIPVKTVTVEVDGETETLECVSDSDYFKILDNLMAKNGLSVLERNKAALEHPDVFAGSFAFYTKERIIKIIGNFTKML
jgi:hypothetical protein